MTDPVIAAARASAGRLAVDYGPGLYAEIEAALSARGSHTRREQYFDPVSVAGLIISIATLAWTVYADLRKKTPNPSPDLVAQAVLIEVRALGQDDRETQDKITEVVVTEIIKAVSEQG